MNKSVLQYGAAVIVIATINAKVFETSAYCKLHTHNTCIEGKYYTVT
jgi:hypothetical protein